MPTLSSIIKNKSLKANKVTAQIAFFPFIKCLDNRCYPNIGTVEYLEI